MLQSPAFIGQFTQESEDKSRLLGDTIFIRIISP